MALCGTEPPFQDPEITIDPQRVQTVIAEYSLLVVGDAGHVDSFGKFKGFDLQYFFGLTVDGDGKTSNMVETNGSNSDIFNLAKFSFGGDFLTTQTHFFGGFIMDKFEFKDQTLAFTNLSIGTFFHILGMIIPLD